MAERQVVIGDRVEPVDRFGGVDDGVVGARVLQFDELAGSRGTLTGALRDPAGPQGVQFSAWSDWSYLRIGGSWEVSLLQVSITRATGAGVVDLQLGVLGFHIAVTWSR